MFTSHKKGLIFIHSTLSIMSACVGLFLLIPHLLLHVIVMELSGLISLYGWDCAVNLRVILNMLVYAGNCARGRKRSSGWCAEVIAVINGHADICCRHGHCSSRGK